MRKLRKLINRILSLLIVLSLNFTASAIGAELKVNGSYTVETGKVDIAITGAGPSTAVIKVYMTEEPLKYAYLTEYDFDSYGKAEFFFTMPTLKENVPSGEYTIQITQGTNSATETFRHMNALQANEKIGILNKCGKDGFIAALRGAYSDFGIDIVEFNENADDITELMYRFEDMSSIGIYDFWNIFHASVLLSQMKGAENGVIQTGVAENKKLLRVNETIFSLFDEKIESEFYKRISDGVYSQSTLENQIKEWMILSVINSSEVYTKVQNIVENNSTFIGLDLTEYNSSKNKEAIIKDFMNTSAPYNSLPSVVTAFNKSVLANKGQGKADTPSYDGGGGGGGGGPSKVTIEDISSKEESSPKGFSDVPVDHWAYKYINTLSAQGKINGVGENRFEPERNITRAEFAKLIAAQFFNEEEEVYSSFSDVKVTDWYYSYVAELEKYGVLMGDGNGCFNPNYNITRQDAVVMIKRAADSSGKSYTGFGSTEAFSDNDKISAYAQNAVKWACVASIINGMPDGTFAPFNLLTRAETAKLIYNLQP